MSKRNLLYIFGAALLLSAAPVVSGAGRPARRRRLPLHNREEEEKSSSNPKKSKVKGQAAPTPDRIKEIQTALQKDGSYEGEPTGKWDAATTDAMKSIRTRLASRQAKSTRCRSTNSAWVPKLRAKAPRCRLRSLLRRPLRRRRVHRRAPAIQLACARRSTRREMPLSPRALLRAGFYISIHNVGLGGRGHGRSGPLADRVRSSAVQASGRCELGRAIRADGLRLEKCRTLFGNSSSARIRRAAATSCRTDNSIRRGAAISRAAASARACFHPRQQFIKMKAARMPNQTD